LLQICRIMPPEQADGCGHSQQYWVLPWCQPHPLGSGAACVGVMQQIGMLGSTFGLLIVEQVFVDGKRDLGRVNQLECMRCKIC
jgi:hypothetical protein